MYLSKDGMVVHACNTRTLEEEGKGVIPAARQVQIRHELQETVSSFSYYFPHLTCPV